MIIKSRLSSKVYNPHYLGIIAKITDDHFNNPQKDWSKQKQQGQKKIIQLKKIDKIIKGIIKQKLFGKLLKRDNRLEIYGGQDTKHKQLENSQRLSPKLQPLNQKIIRRSRTSSKAQISIPNQFIQDQFKLKVDKKQNRKINHSEKKLIKDGNIPKLQHSHFLLLQNYFRKIVNIPSNGLIYQYKVYKDQIKTIFKNAETLSDEVIDKFYYFFDIPSPFHFKQYTMHINMIMNSVTLKEVNFFIFQLIDKNKDGLISIEDLFEFLKLNSDNHEYIQHDVFICSQALKKKQQKEQKQQNIHKKKVQLTVDQVLVRNNSLKLYQYRQLSKKQTKNIVNCQIRKSTVYYRSYQALQHELSTRIKNKKIQHTKVEIDENIKQQIKKKERSYLTILDFNQIFNSDRPYIFYCILEVITGIKFQSNK